MKSNEPTEIKGDRFMRIVSDDRLKQRKKRNGRLGVGSGNGNYYINVVTGILLLLPPRSREVSNDMI